MGQPGITAPPPPATEGRLESWKEIAAYLKRSVRTVQQWEKKEGLPVHRRLHDKLGTVYAYQAELDAWWQNGHERLATQEQEEPPEQAAAHPRRRLWALAAAASLVLATAVYLAKGILWPPAPADPGRVMLAVLPFENLGGGAEQEYFSDGLTEEMITRLARLHPERLGVIARTSAMQYKANPRPIEQVCKELGVEYVLEGSVRRENNQVRITAQLIRVSDRTHLWADSYERELANVLVIQGEVARQVAHSLSLRLLSSDQARLARRQPASFDAYEAYLQARYFANLSAQRSGASRQSVLHYQKAIEIDPNYALAYAGLAETYAFSLPTHEAMPKARDAALKALALDDTLPEAHSALGLVKLFYEWDWAGAERAFKRAIALDPGSAAAHYRYVYYLWAQGRVEEAIAEASLAAELDPFSPTINNDLGRAYYYARQYDRAIEQYKKALELDPNYSLAHFFLGIAYEQKGLHDQAIAEFRKARELAGDSRLAESLGQRYATSGFRGALEAWAEDWETGVEQGRVQPTSVALIYARLGDRNKAFEWLEKSYRERTRAMVYLRVEPQFDSLRSDPRFQNLLRRMNFPD